MIVIVDYGMGNLKSVSKAIMSLGARARVTDSSRTIKAASKIILPGVGHFGKAVTELTKRKIFSPIKKQVEKGVPFLGICVGMQLLFDESEEAKGKSGFGIIRGSVKRFPSKSLIIPHMGWNQVMIASRTARASALFNAIAPKSHFYFAHSYYCKPQSRSVVLSRSFYGISFASSVNKDTVWAIQFHPEKSQTVGLRLLKNFIVKCK